MKTVLAKADADNVHPRHTLLSYISYLSRHVLPKQLVHSPNVPGWVSRVLHSIALTSVSRARNAGWDWENSTAAYGIPIATWAVFKSRREPHSIPHWSTS